MICFLIIIVTLIVSFTFNFIYYFVLISINNMLLLLSTVCHDQTYIFAPICDNILTEHMSVFNFTFQWLERKGDNDTFTGVSCVIYRRNMNSSNIFVIKLFFFIINIKKRVTTLFKFFFLLFELLQLFWLSLIIIVTATVSVIWCKNWVGLLYVVCAVNNIIG